MSDPPEGRGDRFLAVGALLTALFLSLIGLVLSSWAHAFAADLFGPGATLPAARDVVLAGPRSLWSMIPFALVALVHGAALLITKRLASAPRAGVVVATSAAGVVAAGLAFGEERPLPVIVVLALAFSFAAAAGYASSHLIFRMRAQHTDRRI